MTRIIGPIDIDERKPVVFPFARALGSATIGTCVVTCEAVSGVDAAASTRLIGEPVIAGSNVTQWVAGCLVGVTYKLRAKATDSAGGVHVCAYTLPAVRL